MLLSRILGNIIILSMSKSIRRRNFMNFKMKNIGLNNYLYFDAIDGKKSKSYNDYENYCRKNQHKILTGDKVLLDVY